MRGQRCEFVTIIALSSEKLKSFNERKQKRVKEESKEQIAKTQTGSRQRRFTVHEEKEK